MKVNFETEMATVQKLLEAQQLNLQIVSMLPALGFTYLLSNAGSRTFKWLKTDPLRPQLDLEAVLHRLSREILAERTVEPGSSAARRARGVRCLLAWQAGILLQGGRASSVLAKDQQQLRKDVARLASPEIAPEHLALLLDVVFRQLRRVY